MKIGLSVLGLFRVGPLTEDEFRTAAGRHGLSPSDARTHLRALAAEGMLHDVCEEGGGPETVHGLTGRGRTTLEDMLRAVAAEAGRRVSGTEHTSLLLGRPESTSRDAEGEPVAMVVGGLHGAEILDGLWPPQELPQYTPTRSLAERREESWWPWTVPDPCGCVWAKSPGGHWRVLAGFGTDPCPAPPASLAVPRSTRDPVTDGPLVTAIMPTADRRHFVRRAIDYFLAQTYRARELVIVDDGTETVEDLIPDVEDIRYLRLEGRNTIGSKMNAGVAAARGEIISQWDDDDWHGPGRIAAQVGPLLDDTASIVGFEGAPFYFVKKDQSWAAPNALMRLHRKGGIHCGTLVYRRTDWEATEGYPDLSFFEQTTFLERVLAAGGRLGTVPNAGHYVQIRHGSNTWRDDVMGIPGWAMTEGMPWLPTNALEFYRSLHGPFPVEGGAKGPLPPRDAYPS